MMILRRHVNEIFFELAIVILTASVLSLIMHRLKQPLIIAYIFTGIIAGPSLLGLTTSMELFETLSSIGIAFLLFIVGLNLNWRNVHEVGKVALVLGLAQVVVTTIIGWLIGLIFHFDTATAIFVALALSFSSTIIIVKLLTDKEDFDRLYGRIAVGVLIVQDLIAIAVLLAFATFQGGADITTVLTTSLVKVVLVVGVLMLIGKYVIPRLFKYAAKSIELLFVLAIAWCFAVASALQLLGFSIELGALLAGLTLAGTGFQHEIEAKVRVLRDFFLIIFFIVLGTQLVGGDFGSLWLPSLVFGLFILVGKPTIVLAIMNFMGYHPRTGFLVGTSLAQISEFSFILLGGAIASGMVDSAAMPLATIVSLVTIAGSSYLISFNERVFDFLAKYLPCLNPEVTDQDRGKAAPQIVMLGYDRMGRKILPMIEALTKNFAVVDYDPNVIEELTEKGVTAIYGDAGSEDLLKFVRADKAKLLISTIPAMAVNEDITDYLKRRHSQATVILTVKFSQDAARCYGLGATFVIVPSVMGGELFAQILKRVKTTKTKWGSLGKKELEALEL